MNFNFLNISVILSWSWYGKFIQNLLRLFFGVSMPQILTVWYIVYFLCLVTLHDARQTRWRDHTIYVFLTIFDVLFRKTHQFKWHLWRETNVFLLYIRFISHLWTPMTPMRKYSVFIYIGALQRKTVQCDVIIFVKKWAKQIHTKIVL